jgi:glycosyltransferase involved in cell wall biosynthesis
MDPLQRIFICEPQCRGSEHADFNAALLRTVELAFPQARVWFAAEADHLRWVRSRRSDGEGSVGWLEIEVPPPRGTWLGRNGPRGLRAAGRFWSAVRALAQDADADLLVLASITPPGLMAWKATSRSDHPPAVIIPHGMLASVEGVGLRDRSRAALLRLVFRWRAPGSLRYVALGGSIHAALREIDPRMAAGFSTLEIPNLWTADPPAEAEAPLAASFGYFGVAARRFVAFERLAARVRETHPDVEFRLIGFQDEPLTSAEYARRAGSITHAVWTGEPEHYRLTASASYIDAIAFGKPVVAMRNAFVEHYFSQLGDIGYLCDSEAAMLETLAALAHDFPRERYRAQCANLARARSRFAPDTLAGPFRRIVEQAVGARVPGARGALRTTAGWLRARASGIRRRLARGPGVDFDRALSPAPGSGVLFVLSGVPIDDSGGGARCTQIAQESLRQGEAVVFINRFPKHESIDLRLRFEHPRLLSGPLTAFDLDRFLARHPGLLAGRPVGVLVEFAVPEFLPLIDRLRERGAVVAYDLLDDWDTSLGAAWYRPATERAVVEAADVLIATAPSLAGRLARVSGRPVEILPNAVNLGLFDAALGHARPADLPRAEWVALYCGALWGDWLDWDLLLAAAARFPRAAFVLVGDYRGQCPRTLPNVHFLGLKSQAALPAYLAHSDATFLPWKVGAITEATSPLKVYESLAMRKPVVAPWLSPLEGMPFVLRSRDGEEFLRNLERAHAIAPGGPALDRFLDANSWAVRTRRLLELVRAAAPRKAALA